MPDNTYLGFGEEVPLSKDPIRNDLNRGVDTNAPFLGFGVGDNKAPEDIAGYFPNNTFDTKLDKYVTVGDLPDVNEERAQMQSGWTQVANGTIKGLGTAATTFATTFTSLPYGILSAAVGLADPSITSEQAISRIYDNPISRAYDQFSKTMEQQFPNYYTKQEQNASTFSPNNWFTPNFLADKLIKNAGFTVGAIGSGALVGKGLSALGKIAMAGKYEQELAAVTKLASQYTAEGLEESAAFTKALTEVGKTIKFNNGVQTIGATTIAAGNEATFEGLQTKQQTTQQIVDQFKKKNGRDPNPQELNEIDKYASAAGNIDYLTNLAILGGSDYIQFGRILSGAKNEAKAAMNGITRSTVGEYVAEQASRFTKPLIATKGLFTEAAEEGSQTLTQSATSDYFARKYDNPSKDSFADKLNSIGYGLSQTFGTKQGLESMLLGALTGVISGGATGEIKHELHDADERAANTQNAVDYLNKYSAKDIFLKNEPLIDSAVRAESIGKDMDKAVQSGDIYQFKNLQHDLFKNLVQSRIDTGKLDDLVSDLQDLKHLPKEEFEKTWGIDPSTNDKQSTGQYVDNLITEAKNLGKLKENIDLRFPNLSKDAREALWSTVGDIDNTTKRISDLQLKIAKSPETLIATQNYLQSKSKENLDILNKIVQDQAIVLESTGENSKQLVQDYILLNNKKQQLAEIYKNAITPKGQEILENNVNEIRETSTKEATQRAEAKAQQAQQTAKNNRINQKLQEVQPDEFADLEAEMQAMEQEGYTPSGTKETPNSETIPNEVQKPIMITKDMHRQLADLGYNKEDRSNLTPEKANEIIKNQTVQSKDKFIGNEQTNKLNKLTPEIDLTKGRFGEIETKEEATPKTVEQPAEDIEIKKQTIESARTKALQGVDFIQQQNPNLDFIQERININNKFDQQLENLTKPKDEELSTEQTVTNTLEDTFNYDSNKEKDIQSNFDNTEDRLEELEGTTIPTEDGGIIYERKKITNGYSTLARLDRQYEEVREGNVIKLKEVSNELNPDLFTPILNPDKYQQGTEVTLRVLDKDETPIYETIDGVYVKSTWGAKKGTISAEEVDDVIPIGIYDSEDNLIGYLHDTNWVSDRNVMNPAEDKKALQDIREYLGKNKEFKTTITGKSFGKLFKTVGNKSITLTEANEDPNIQFGVGYSDSTLKIGKGKSFDGSLVNQKNLVPGATYVIAKVGKDNTGTDTNLAIPVFNSRIEHSQQKDSIISSITTAIRIFLKNEENYTAEEKKFHDAILENAKLNIANSVELSEYLSGFINIYNVGKGGSLKSLMDNPLFLATKPGVKKSNAALFTINGGNIEFTLTGKTYFISKNSPKEQWDMTLSNLSKAIPNMFVNTSLNYLDSNKSVVTYDGTNITNVPYTTFLKDNLKTNVLAKQVDEVDGKPIFTYMVQPMIRLDFSSIIKPKEESSEEISNPTNPEQLTQQEVIKQQEDKPKLNFDYIFDLPLTEEQVKGISDITSKYYIKDLGLTKQESLTNSLTRVILGKINQNKGKLVSPNETYEEYKNKFEADLKTLESLNDAKYNRIISDLNAITSNWETIVQSTNRKLAKINNIKQKFNDDVELQDLDNTDNERQLWDQMSYTTDPKSGISKEVKRFLSDIDARNLDGTIKKNFLGLPEVMSFDEVYNALQSMTANLPVTEDRLETIIAAISQYEHSSPWVKGVIEKLRVADSVTKAQFVRIMTNSYANSKFIMWRQDKNTGDYYYENRNANSNSIAQVLVENWKGNFIQSRESTEVEDASYGFSEDLRTKITVEFKKMVSGDITIEQAKDWLGNFGIDLDSKTWEELYKQTKKNNKKGLSWKDLFTNPAGVFNILNKNILLRGNVSLEENNLYADGSVQELALKDAKYRKHVFSNSYRSGGRTVYSYGKNKFLINAVTELTNNLEASKYNGEDVFTSRILTQKAQLAFNKEALWLKNSLRKDAKGEFIKAENGNYIVDSKGLLGNLDYFVVDLMAIKQLGTNVQEGKEMNNLSPAEYEMYKLGQLQASQADNTNSVKRIINLLYPTTSDKTTVHGITTEAVKLEFNRDGSLAQSGIDTIYNQTVLPEINRIKLFEALKASGKLSEVNHKEYEEHYNLFYMIPEINNIEELFDKNGNLNLNIQTPEFRSKIDEVIKSHLDALVKQKLESWNKYGIGQTIKDTNGKVIKKETYLDKRYLDGFKGIDNSARVKVAATDMVVQYLIGNANSYMMFIGDPAQYFKKDIENTFINIGKRLAGDIAPAEESIGTTNQTYKQIVLADKNSQSLSYDSLVELLGEEKAKKYKEFDGTDAQELTTVLEHLNVMNMYGDGLPTGFYNTVKTTINREIAAGNHYYTQAILDDLNKVDKEWSDLYKHLILQPMKPKYVQNIIDTSLGIEKRVYIKSSSYALNPEETRGFEIDKLRIMMEKQGIDRAAFKTAVKVGSPRGLANIWNEDGTIADNVDFSKTTLELPRNGFGIQQVVPHDELDNAINRVSQASKNLFINMLDVDGFQFEGKTWRGIDLQKRYHDIYNELFKLNKEELFKQLGLDDNAKPIDEAKFISQVRDLLKEEIVNRDYPLSDADSLDLDEALTFLSFSPAADKYESLLNSIIQNRIIKTEMGGKSYVVSSEEGWQLQSGKSLQESSIKFTRNFKGKLQPNQVIVSFEFLDNNKELLDINNFLDKEGYVDINKIPKEILQGFVMRIPNQGPNSQRSIEIVGFLPHSAGSRMICSRDLVVQMGQDFDVDKLYNYLHNTYYDAKTGNIKLVTEKGNKAQYLQNQILDIHLAIHANEDPRVQKQIKEPLGFWKLPEIADFVYKNSKRFKSDTPFTGMSDEYQKMKFYNATSGKAGVGVYSSLSMFNAIIQGKDLVFTTKDAEGNTVPLEFTIGNETFNGDLSNPYTNKSTPENPTYKSDVIAGDQSASVDNEKEQILFKINLNNVTFNAKNFLDLAGFEEVGPLLLSQDIIFDYVDTLTKYRSGLEGYIPNMDEVVYKEVVSKYAQVEGVKVNPKDLTESKLKSLIKDNTLSENYNNYQKLCLDLFLEADQYGKAIVGVQNLVNTDSKGLEKSLFETNIREENLERLFTSPIKNADRLLGDFDEEGNFINPTTINGQAIYYGLLNNNKIWNRLFPYKQMFLERTFQRAEELFNKGEKSNSNRAEFRRTIWNAVKSYLYSNKDLGLVDTEIAADRNRLFIDSDTNKSLGSIVKELQSRTDLQNNPLLTRLNVAPNKNGLPTLIKFNAAAKQNTDEVNIYTSFIDMIVANKPLDEFNGKQYTSRDLAEDLIKYSYLSGGIQQAIEFTKYIPVSYLHSIPFAQKLSDIVTLKKFEDDKFLGVSDAKGAPYYQVANLLVQFAQHDPKSLPSIDHTITTSKQVWVTEGNRLEVQSIKSFGLMDNSLYVMRKGYKTPVPPEFITIYDANRKPKGINKNYIFKYSGVNKEINGKVYPLYEKIDNLGTFGMSEYNSNLRQGELQTSVLEGNKVTKTVTQPMVISTTPTSVTSKVVNTEKEVKDVAKELGLVNNGNKKSLLDVLTNISINSEDPYYKLLAEEFIKNSSHIPEDIKIDTNWKQSRGRSTQDSFHINTEQTKSALEETLLHELTHVYLTKYTLTYEKGDMKTLMGLKNPDLMRAIKNLHNIFTDYSNSIDKVELEEFNKELKESIANKTKIPEERIAKYYPATKFGEFVSMLTTNKEFQKILNETPYKGDKTFWESIWENIVKYFKALGFDVKEHNALATALDDVIYLIKQDYTSETTGEKVDELLPSTISKKEVLQNFKELNADGTQKHLPLSDTNYRIMFERAKNINKSQPYYKATVGKVLGEGGKREFYSINLEPRTELNLAERAKYISEKEVLDRMKLCK